MLSMMREQNETRPSHQLLATSIVMRVMLVETKRTTRVVCVLEYPCIGPRDEPGSASVLASAAGTTFIVAT